MLSSVCLSFVDREMRMTFEREKKKYYARILLIIWPILMVLTIGLFVLDRMSDDY